MYETAGMPYWAGAAQAFVPGMREWMAWAQYWAITNNLPRHDWTPHQMIDECGNASLLRFGGDGDKGATLIVPPQASHSPSGCDFGPGRSLVEAAQNAGIGAVHAASWKNADFSRRDEDIGSFITTTDKFVNTIGKKINVIGVCQGGWHSAIYAALYPEKVKTLTLIAAPVDFHGGDSKITEWINLLPDWWFRYLVATGNGVLDGRYILLAFKLMHPSDRFFWDNWWLYQDILAEDWDAVQQKTHFRSWYDHTQNIPGAFYLQVVRDLFKKNLLVKGELEILGQKVDLGKIRCPVFIVTGENDDITPEPQACAIADCVGSTCSCQQFKLKKTGHFGAFAGADAMKRYQEEIFPAIKAAA